MAPKPEIIEAEWSEDGDESADGIPRMRDLLLETIQAFRANLKKETPNNTTVGHLLQLMKLHKELLEEDETPTHIELIWNEVDEGLYGDD